VSVATRDGFVGSGNVPDQDCPVKAARNQEVAVGAERDAGDGVGVVAKRCEAAHAGRIADVPDHDGDQWPWWRACGVPPCGCSADLRLCWRQAHGRAICR
jgi:hypothetical protein